MEDAAPEDEANCANVKGGVEEMDAVPETLEDNVIEVPLWTTTELELKFGTPLLLLEIWLWEVGAGWELLLVDTWLPGVEALCELLEV